MKNFKLIFLFFLSILFILSSKTVLSQNTLEDYGLSQEAIKYLSQEEIQNILNSKTPTEIIAEEKARINQSGTAEEKEAINNPQPVNPNLLDNTVNCFDYYEFGSVQTALTSQNLVFNAGDTINFNGPVINKNDYPIVNGTLYVKIFKNINTIKNTAGPDVIDQFIAVDNISIPAKGQTIVSFPWLIPTSAINGDYKIASFFTTDKKFNLLGLNFTDDVIGNTFNFHINGNKSNVQFDKSGVFINDIQYHFAAYPLRISISDPAVISTKIDNTTNNNETISINWQLYKWDSINPNNLISTISETITIEANSSKNIQIAIPEAEEPVYFLIGELTYKDSKSILNIRFVRPEIDKIRINFPSIANFPIKSGVSNTLFSCLHNSGTSQIVKNGKLILKITDINGKTIKEHIYEGSVTGEMMAVKKDFTSMRDIDHFFLTAQLWQADKLVDESKLEYDCNKIDPSTCIKSYNYKLLIILVIALLIFLFAISVFFLKKKKFKIS